MRLLFVFILLPFYLLSQNTIGFPTIVNYNKSVYKGGLQTWDIKQDKNGIMYFANNEGLITFNGKQWKNHPLPNKTIVRSVEIAANGNIYVGGQDEIGFFSPKENGELFYTSLVKLIDNKHQNFGDVWDVISQNENIFFRSDNTIFKLSNNKFQIFTTSNKWLFLGLAENKLYAQDNENKLLFFENDTWKNTNIVFPNKATITSIMPFKNNVSIITTLKNGVFSLKNNTNILTNLNSLSGNNFQIYAAKKVNDSWYALATNNNGIYICNLDGKIIQNISKTEGLIDNNNLSIQVDVSGNIWLGLNNGISLIKYNSAIKHINPFFEDAAGYAAIIHDKKLYFGTANKLYSIALQDQEDITLNKGIFNKIIGIEGQTWCLNSINNKLLLGHHDGAFILENDIPKSISNTQGIWNFIPTNSVFPSPKMICGNYNGLSLFNFINNQFSNEINITNFHESSRFVTIDANENIWISHPYHGVFELVKTNNENTYKSKQFGLEQGLPSNLNNHIYKIKNEIVVTSEKGIYNFNPAKNKFEPNVFYNKILNNKSIRYVKEDTEGNVWFVHEKSMGVIDFSSKEPKVIYLPELNNKLLSGFEFVYPIDKKNILISGEKGFYVINFEKYKQQFTTPEVQLRLAKIEGNVDTVLFGGYFTSVNEIQNKNKPSVKHGWQILHFEYSSTSSFNSDDLVYSYRLKGLDNNWSAWTDQTEKEYTNLNAGTYVFEIKVKNSLELESKVSSFTFAILPPWYNSIWTKFICFLLCLGIVYWLYKKQKTKLLIQQKKHDEEQAKLKYIHDLEINKTEAEIIALQNDKLAQEVDFKNSELASSAMHLVQKGEIIAKVKTSLNQITKLYGISPAATEIKRLLKSLGEDENIDKEWDVFSKHFDNVHKDFLASLKEKHPNITSSELKLSAYLYMNLSTKEIAQLMNISVRGVEISRYRLRKKLELSTEISLFDYMMNVGKKT